MFISTKSILVSLAAAALAWSGTAPAQDVAPLSLFADAPEGFIPPPLHPQGAKLQTVELADGVYALVSNQAAVDNSGFVVGERGVLVIDSHINKEMAQQILDAVRAVTDKPILYLANTNYHGDHTFGNYVFPASTIIVAHRLTAEKMLGFENEKRSLLPTVNGNASVYGDVKLRLPDLVFDRYLRLDLGGRLVELHHFGAGNTPGDIVVFVPEARVAWTGNFIIGEGSNPPLFETGAATYLATLTKMRATLDVETIVPGHLGITDDRTIDRYLGYMGRLVREVRAAIHEGKTVEELLGSSQLGADPFLEGFHRMNLVQTYKEESARLGDSSQNH